MYTSHELYITHTVYGTVYIAHKLYTIHMKRINHKVLQGLTSPPNRPKTGAYAKRLLAKPVVLKVTGTRPHHTTTSAFITPPAPPAITPPLLSV